MLPSESQEQEHVDITCANKLRKQRNLLHIPPKGRLQVRSYGAHKTKK